MTFEEKFLQALNTDPVSINNQDIEFKDFTAACRSDPHLIKSLKEGWDQMIRIWVYLNPEDGKYTAITGRRRLRLCKESGLSVLVQCLVWPGIPTAKEFAMLRYKTCTKHPGI